MSLARHPEDKQLEQLGMFNVNGDLHLLGGNYVTNVSNHFHRNHTANDVRHALDTLFNHCAQHAIHSSETVSSQGMCLGGTRTSTIAYLTNHLTTTDPGACDLVWFRGPAGGGKSAVMRTIAHSFTSNDSPDHPQTPVASFFFFRSDGRRNATQNFIPTLAYQMARELPSTLPFLAAAIHNDPAVFSQSLLRQARSLIADPLHRAADNGKATRFIIIVDGLDECTGSSQKQAEVIDALAAVATTLRKQTSCRVKILIASRPEHVIQNRFDVHEEHKVASVFTLDPSDAELGLFYDTKLKKMRRTHGLPSSWPSKRQRQVLIDKTSGQYAFANTAMRFTAGGDPEKRLEMVLNAVSSDGCRPLDQLDQLYAFVFSQLPPEILSRTLDVVGALLLTDQHSIELPILGIVLNVPTSSIHRLSIYLSSLFKFEKHEITVYHATLGDFLFDPNRAGQFGLLVRKERIYKRIVRGYFSTITMSNKIEKRRVLHSMLLAFNVDGPGLRRTLQRINSITLVYWITYLLLQIKPSQLDLDGLLLLKVIIEVCQCAIVGLERTPWQWMRYLHFAILTCWVLPWLMESRRSTLSDKSFEQLLADEWQQAADSPRFKELA